MRKILRVGQFIKVLGPTWFPFVHTYVIERVITDKEDMVLVEMRLAEYHGDLRATLTWTGLDKCMLEVRGVAITVLVEKV